MGWHADLRGGRRGVGLAEARRALPGGAQSGQPHPSGRRPVLAASAPLAKGSPAAREGCSGGVAGCARQARQRCIQSAFAGAGLSVFRRPHTARLAGKSLSARMAPASGKLAGLRCSGTRGGAYATLAQGLAGGVVDFEWRRQLSS